MDFAICPSCKQSVLDDDAVNCPFCGASMKAKPGAAKPAPASAAAGTSAAKATSGKLASTKTSPSPDTAVNAPLDLGHDLAEQAIPASTTRTKSRPLRVKCPMCESVGYVPTQAAGQSVKCVNPKCMMPVFTAPESEPAAPPPPPPPPKPKRSLLMVAGVTTVLVSAAGGIAWWVARQPETIEINTSQADLELMKEIAQQQTQPPSQTETTAITPEPKTSPKIGDSPPEEPAKLINGANWQAGILKMMNDASLQPRLNRSKPYCRRLTAEAFAITGNLDGARDQLAALDKVGSAVPFYRVTPYVELAWQQLARGDKQAAAKSVTEAWKSAVNLPKTGRDRLESAIALAAVLIATERAAEAQQLLQTHQTSDALGQLAAMHRAVLVFGTFDLAATDARRPALPWQAPLLVGVSYELTARGKSEIARNWADKLPDPRDRSEALAAWAEGVVWKSSLSGTEIPLAELQAPLSSLPSPGNILAMSRLGVGLSLAGNRPAAEACLSIVTVQVEKVESFAEEPLPDGMKELARFQPRDPKPREFLAAAIGEASHLATLVDQTEQADSLLQAALTQLRTLAPNPASIQRRLKQTDALGINDLREQLRKELKLKTREDALVEANGYKKNLDDWTDAARRRADLQAFLLREAVSWGLLDPVWNYIRRGPTKEDAAEADDLIYTDLPSLLAERYAAARTQDQLELVTAAWNQLVPDRKLGTSPATILREALQATDSKQYQQAAELINGRKGVPVEQDQLAMRAVCEAARQGKYQAALIVTSRFADAVLKEECYWMIAAMAARAGQEGLIEQHLKEIGQASEKIAICRGLLAGALVRNSEKSSESAL